MPQSEPSGHAPGTPVSVESSDVLESASVVVLLVPDSSEAAVVSVVDGSLVVLELLSPVALVSVGELFDDEHAGMKTSAPLKKGRAR